MIIINPKSGAGINRSRILQIKNFLDDRRVNYEIKYTRAKDDAAEFADSALEKNFSCVVSVGGDGTSSQIVNSIQGSDILFTVIPSGSANDFPKAAGIPIDLELALKNIVNGKTRTINVGKFENRFFINGFGVGLDGAVANRFKMMRFLGGFFGYLSGAFIEAFKFPGFKAEVNTGGSIYKGEFLLVGASNGPTQGGIKLAPEASISDNLLDVYLIRNMGLIKRLNTLKSVLSASHTKMDEVSIIKLEEVKLTIDRDIPAHIDGETFELKKGTHNISIIRNGLKVLTSSQTV